ncbi:hypothetical protein PHYC_01221 [Phycisphaerales bacterium]|nr:hypothetical protein PHYC_01221 [Phycisphaerales bacterium]
MRTLSGIVLLALAGCGAPRAEPVDVGRAPGETNRRSAYLPSLHGFRFVNHFEGSPLPAALRNPTTGASLIGGGKSIPSTFGLCGGMSLASADYYHAGVAPPARTTPPEQGTGLYEYIYQRQAESFGDGAIMVAAFMSWMNLPDNGDDGTGARSARELPGIVSRLERGEVFPLGLVLVRSPSNRGAPSSPVGRLWNNHQVLAFGVQEREGGVVEVAVYDPNFPGDDGVIVRFAAVGESVRLERVTGRGRKTTVRGVFPMPYAVHAPPENAAE